MNRMRIEILVACVALAGMAYCHIEDVGMKFEEHVYYMAILFLGNIALSLVLIPALVVAAAGDRTRALRALWAVTGGLALLTIAGFLWSRTIGFPQMADHVGEWDRLGLSSVLLEVILVALSAHALLGVRVHPLAAATGVVALAALAALAASASSAHGMHMMMRGDPRPYPKVAHATPAQRRAAESLVRRTQANAPRFRHARHASAMGFHRSRREDVTVGFPALRHYRKRHSMGSHSRLLDPRRPQALVYWCTAPHACTLAAFMYRAKAAHPPTFGPLMAWHKHAAREPWMTHVWLTGHLRSALARCAPWPHLEQALAIRRRGSRVDSPADMPCPEGAHDGM